MQETVLITGCSSGIGKATALLMGKTYKKIAIMGYRNPEKIEHVKSKLQANGVECISACGDISDYTFVADFVNEIIATWGHIDILINNAGVSFVGLLTDMDINTWHHIMDTNATQVFNTCRNVVPHMVHEKSGRIINVSSIWGNVGASCEVAYSASKGAINAFTKALGKELAPSGISVNAIAFGVIDTPMNNCFSTDEKAALAEDIPVGRMASPEEAASFILTILNSPQYLTAQVIIFDGGYL